LIISQGCPNDAGSEVLLSAVCGRKQNALAKARWREESREGCFQVSPDRLKSLASDLRVSLRAIAPSRSPFALLF
jgi:hypothetical protein